MDLMIDANGSMTLEGLPVEHTDWGRLISEYDGKKIPVYRSTFKVIVDGEEINVISEVDAAYAEHQKDIAVARANESMKVLGEMAAKIRKLRERS